MSVNNSSIQAGAMPSLILTQVPHVVQSSLISTSAGMSFANEQFV